MPQPSESSATVETETETDAWKWYLPTMSPQLANRRDEERKSRKVREVKEMREILELGYLEGYEDGMACCRRLMGRESGRERRSERERGGRVRDSESSKRSVSKSHNSRSTKPAQKRGEYDSPSDMYDYDPSDSDSDDSEDTVDGHLMRYTPLHWVAQEVYWYIPHPHDIPLAPLAPLSLAADYFHVQAAQYLHAQSPRPQPPRQPRTPVPQPARAYRIAQTPALPGMRKSETSTAYSFTAGSEWEERELHDSFDPVAICDWRARVRPGHGTCPCPFAGLARG